MAHHRSDVLAHAVTLLDAHGLGALTMRRLGAELGVQPSAIYHHFANKQTLLAAVAEEILARGARPRTADEWPDRLREVCAELRDAMLACTDGADVVATVWAFGLGAAAPAAELEQVLTDAEAPRRAGRGGHPHPAPLRLRPRLRGADRAPGHQPRRRRADLESLPDFDLGLDLVIDGLRARVS